ncbi:hypothetical protein [Photobacterium leiognathi]|uniref:hypothetical protein n=1 Tax=Photobacterium leiognathi TaxID=553611 RepID=UPI00273925E2|nr:hypothetical protein [Photobacterium leiognathi]
MATTHLQGMNGCRECIKKARTLTTQTFIKKAQMRWGKTKFDYSKSHYTASRDKLIISCREHGCEFEQKAANHLFGINGCPECNKRYPLGTDSFICKSKAVWNDKFDYSKTEYRHPKHKVTLTCREHGCDFKQFPSNHLNKMAGCPKCKSRIISKNRLKDTAQYIREAKEVWGNQWDYSKVVYTHSHNKITIICPIHGEFYKLPTPHIKLRQGCPKCGKSRKP